MKTLLLIDGHAIIHRAFHALPPLVNKDGIPTNAVYGFFNMIHKAIVDYQPDSVIVCFDTPKPTFRKELLKEYQATRPKMDDTLVPQIGIIKQLLEKAKIKCLEKEGFEADDVIGTLATKFKDTMKVLILTGDKDILQLVDTNVYVISPQIGMSKVIIYDPEKVKEKFSIEPKYIPDYKSLVGDQSDNYSTAKGIGPKTAVKLLNQFTTIENLIANSDQIENEKIRNIIEEYKDKIILLKTIATIVTTVEMEYNDVDAEYKGFDEEMKKDLMKLQLFSIITRLFNGRPQPEKPKAPPRVEEKEEKKEADQIGLF